MRYYYTDAANQPAGPAELEQLQALAAEGKINDFTSVIPEGGQTWITYGALKSTAAPASSTPRPAPANLGPRMPVDTILGDFVGRSLVRISGWLSPALLRGSLGFAGRYGHFAVLAGAVLGLILAAVSAGRMHSFMFFATAGIGFVLAVAVAQFSAQRFMAAGAKLIATTPNQLSSKSFLECVGLFAILGAVGSLVGGLVTSVQSDSILPMIPALLMVAYLLFFAMIALHPEEVNVNISGEATAGEEAISLLSFFTKIGLKLAPLFFFLLALVGAIFALLALFSIGQDASQAFLSTLPLLPQLGAFAQSLPPGPLLVLLACLVPVIAYVFFLLWYLALDLMRAVLAVPRKLDELKKS